MIKKIRLRIFEGDSRFLHSTASELEEIVLKKSPTILEIKNAIIIDTEGLEVQLADLSIKYRNDGQCSQID